ncbi:MAG TPA: tetratricopeptide repeat protein [Stellaceae bacterium]|jgi:tetratricopeptide (TPR) repeat protein|nr:tetratricopeptide repeat protein [Stellaceae bacterium]
MRWGLSLVPAIAVWLAAAPVWAAGPATSTPPAPPSSADLVGDYLAGRAAQATRDFPAAAAWYEKAMALDPQAPELISRTFLMEVSVGRFDRAKQLAEQELKLDPSDALAELVRLVDRLKANDAAGALKFATALPGDGIHRFIGPLALAWTRMAAGDLAGADTALQGLDKFNGFQLVKTFQLGLLYDFGGKPDKAEDYYNKALATGEQLNWRVVDVVANFHTRRGHADKAKELYQRFLQQNSSSELAQSVLASRAAGTPPASIRSPADGLAEALFDLASVLNQAETIDLSLVYDRFALALRPDFPLAQLLLADVLSAENKPDQSLAVLGTIPANSPYSWSARLRMAINLDTLDRTDEAIAKLKEMIAEKPQWAGANIELGDLFRAKKRFGEAVEAYDQAMQRIAAAGLPERWVLFYDRGVALERTGQWDRAEADLQHALQMKPDQPLVLNYLGYSWIDRGVNLDQGLEMIKKAVQLRADDGYIVDSLGWAYYRLGDYEKATENLEKAIELVPEDPTINDHLGDAYWRIGRLVEARYQWKRALQFGPEKDEVKPIEAKLENGLNARATPPRGG